MEDFVDLCSSFGLPVWMASLLRTCRRLRSDHARRKKAYRILCRRLMLHGVGVQHGEAPPTYVYPEEVKQLMRCAFPNDISDHPDPQHHRVVYVSVEDLQQIQVKV